MKWKDYFAYTKNEKRGIFVMVFLILALMVLRVFFIPAKIPWLTSEIQQQELRHYQRQLYIEEKKKKQFTKKRTGKGQKSKLRIFEKFNPNILDKAGWMAMGFSEKQAASIMNYRNKGGHFYAPEDVRKMYAVSEDAYRQMLPYIDIPKKSFENEKPKRSAKQRDAVHALSLPINTSSAEDLQAIRGIGPSFSKRIVKYRDLLGGYIHVDQLYEVYGFDSSIVATLLPHILLDTENIAPLNINTASQWELSRHPYLSKKQAYALVQYRKQNGAFSSLKQLANVQTLEAEDIQKILPYLRI